MTKATATEADRIYFRQRKAAARKLRLAIRSAWAASRRPRPDKWVRNAVRLDRQCESASRYDLDARPWWGKILASITDPQIRSVTVMASTQVGKTLTLQAAILYLAENDPAPAMVVLPDADSAIEFRDRLYANALASIKDGKLKRVRVPPRSQWNARSVRLGTMSLYLAWSGARQRLRGRPCRRVFLSEVDVYKGDKVAGNPVAQAHERTKSFWRYLHYHESSPTEYPSPIADLEQAADVRYRWFCPCPKCGHEQELRFFANSSGPFTGKGGVVGVREGSGLPVSPAIARKQAAYECEKCLARIDSANKNEFVASGRWKAISGDEQGEVKSLGFHLWTAHSETQTWGDIGASYCEAVEKNQVRDWWGNWLGLPYRRQSRVPQWVEIGNRLEWKHERGTVPKEAWFLTAGEDVQQDENGCRYVIRAWGPKRTSWLVDWGWIERRETCAASVIREDLAEAGGLILQRSFPVVGGRTQLGQDRLDVALLNIDSGHAPRKVHDWMKSLPPEWIMGGGNERVRAVKGSGQLEDARFKCSVVERNVRTGEAYEGGMAVWRLSVADMYPDFLDGLWSNPETPGAFHFFSGITSSSKSYLQQLCNLERRVKVSKFGKNSIEWGRRSSQIPIDFVDAEIYAAFAAEMYVGDLGWEAERWLEAWKPKPAVNHAAPGALGRYGDRPSAAGEESRGVPSRRRINFRR